MIKENSELGELNSFLMNIAYTYLFYVYVCIAVCAHARVLVYVHVCGYQNTVVGVVPHIPSTWFLRHGISAACNFSRRIEHSVPPLPKTGITGMFYHIWLFKKMGSGGGV